MIIKFPATIINGPLIRLQACPTPGCSAMAHYNTATGEWICLRCNASGGGDYWPMRQKRVEN